MTWRSDERLNARGYNNPEERSAFRAGYSDGYHGYDMWSGHELDKWPNAYSAGYHEGAGDRADDT